jgi:DhnA family fructose-bisphosphate aldolase class Ia
MKNLLPDDGRMVIIAIDHGATLGALDGLEDPVSLYAAVAPWADAVLVSYGSYARHGERLGSTAAILRCDGGWSPLQLQGRDLGLYRLLFDATDAQALGAAATVCMAVFGDEESESSLKNLADLVRSARATGLPVIGEVLFSRKPSIEERCHAVHIAAELGSDMIKTEHPGDDRGLVEICEAAGVPVLVLGGPRRDRPYDALQLAAESVAGGAAGVAFGRNVWQQADPAAWTRALAAVVHEGVAPSEAFKIVRAE